MWEKMETKTIVYDLDTSGGLMEVRVALILFPPVPGGNLRPTKPALSSKRQRAGKRGGGSSSPTQSLPLLFAIWGTELSFRGRLQQFHLPAALDSLPEASAHSISLHRQASPPPSCRPLCASPCTSGYQALGLSRAGLWSPPLSIQGSGKKRTAHPLPIPLP